MQKRNHSERRQPRASKDSILRVLMWQIYIVKLTVDESRRQSTIIKWFLLYLRHHFGTPVFFGQNSRWHTSRQNTIKISRQQHSLNMLIPLKAFPKLKYKKRHIYNNYNYKLNLQCIYTCSIRSNLTNMQLTSLSAVVLLLLKFATLQAGPTLPFLLVAFTMATIVMDKLVRMT